MWLLKTSDLSLVHFHDSRDVRYAILSHTWNGDEEATYAELREGCDMNTARLYKVKMTCAQAAQDGCDYAWIDSCCINKDSLTELAEAINSMWQWYYDASVCYVYLADLSWECPVLYDVASIFSIESDEAPETRWTTAFAACRWFTRGWTLQELLAAKDVRFYCAPKAADVTSERWGFVGDKTDLVRTLWEITGIDILALQDRNSLTRFVTARKMYWASRRQTSKVEDRAYSLLGLFGINMPLLYGEGENAFIRLQEQIIQKRLDHSILAWDCSQSESSQSKDLLFANSPARFAKTGQRMTRWQWSSFDPAFRLTNQGIEFDGLGHVVSTTGERFAMLNCCHEDSAFQAIALRLKENDHAPSAKPCWTPLRYDRLIVLPIQGMSIQPIVLWRYRPTSLLTDIMPQPKIRLVGSSSFRIIAAWPKALWSTDTKVLRVPLQPEDAMPQTVRAGALVHCAPNHVLALVVLSFSTASANAFSRERNPFNFRVALSTSDRVLHNCDSDTIHSELTPAPEILALRDTLIRNLHSTANEAEKETDLGHVFHTSDPSDPSAVAKLIKRTGALPSNGHFFDLYLALPTSLRGVGNSAQPARKSLGGLRAIIGLAGVK
ncbi:hypothetical protein LTR95_008937 [Oleoguttula sp. CCFEE 5521]